MALVVAYHPELDRTAEVEADAMPQLRQSGWLLYSEHQANQAAAEEAAAKKTKSGKAAADETEEK